MPDQAGGAFPPGQPPIAEGLDAFLAMLLMSGRARIRNVNFSGPESLQVELGGEGIRNGLTGIAQFFAMQPQAREVRVAESREEVAEAPLGSALWQALKDFALPPLPQQRKR